MLQVQDLTISYGSAETERRVVDNVSFDLDYAETVGILGESGSGKTTLALSLVGLFSRSARILSGSIRFEEFDVLHATERELQRVRGAVGSIVFQEPATALNPVIRVGDQIAEVVRAHSTRNRRDCKRDAEAILSEVHLSGTRFYRSYPHQLSTGQRQRVAIAQALVCKPKLLIADEATSSLDCITQKDIVDLLLDLRRRLKIAIILISHNPILLSKFADRIFVMYSGQIVEEGPTMQVFGNPKHPYTKGLLSSVPPKPGQQRQENRTALPTISGTPLDSVHVNRGCRFRVRCPESIDVCSVGDPQETRVEGSKVRCFKYER